MEVELKTFYNNQNIDERQWKTGGKLRFGCRVDGKIEGCGTGERIQLCSWHVLGCVMEDVVSAFVDYFLSCCIGYRSGF